MRRLTLLVPLSAVLLAGTATGPPRAQEAPKAHLSCMPAEALASLLEEEFAELPVAWGASDEGVFVTVFAAEATRGWTLAVTEPSGLSCVFAAGAGFELTPEALAFQGGPAPT
jgi:hypothetical protein